MKDLNSLLQRPLSQIYADAWAENFSLPALTDYVSGNTLTYGDMAHRIARMQLFYEQAGLQPGDKVALYGRNTINWISAFMASLTYGAVVVPILQDFNPTDATNILNHSDAKVLFADTHLFEHLDFAQLTNIEAVVSLDTRKILAERDPDQRLHHYQERLSDLMNERYPDGFSASDIKYRSFGADELAVINYTSGTTGFSKGVMLTNGNLMGNIAFGMRSRLHYSGSRALSFLPLAHAYGCAFDMLVPLAVGTHVTLLGKLPSPSLLVKAMSEVRPSLVVCVPLVLEKIYKRMIVPMITGRAMRWVLAVPMLDRAVYSRIRARLVEAFGGCFEELIVGGAPLNPEVEDFLSKINFPFTVGYGMTECGPLISYSPWRKFDQSSSGRTLRDLMQARILGPDGQEVPNDQPGEICVKGQNVMKGYYKYPEATAEVLSSDGWLRTGDMGYLGPDGRTVYIRGRYKTMILAANGQNIYPEEIEAKLNNMPYVAESLVVDRGGRLVALVFADEDTVQRDGVSAAELADVMKENRRQLNTLVGSYEQISAIELVEEEFAKTPKRSIKRFLYS